MPALGLYPSGAVSVLGGRPQTLNPSGCSRHHPGPGGVETGTQVTRTLDLGLATPRLMHAVPTARGPASPWLLRLQGSGCGLQGVPATRTPALSARGPSSRHALRSLPFVLTSVPLRSSSISHLCCEPGFHNDPKSYENAPVTRLRVKRTISFMQKVTGRTYEKRLKKDVILQLVIKY